MSRSLAAALILAALLIGIMVGRSTAAMSRPAQDIPASAFAPIVAVGQVQDGEPDPGRTGAPQPPSPSPTAPSAESAPSRGVAVSGIASWYRDGPGLYAAAGPALRVGHWRGRVVTVCARVCIRVRLTDYCGCYGTRVIDLSAEAFERLAPLSRGLVRVSVQW